MSRPGRGQIVESSSAPPQTLPRTYISLLLRPTAPRLRVSDRLRTRDPPAPRQVAQDARACLDPRLLGRRRAFFRTKWTPHGPRHGSGSPGRDGRNRRVCGGFVRSGRLDLNQRPFGPQPNALPDCATPRGAEFTKPRSARRPGDPRGPAFVAAPRGIQQRPDRVARPPRGARVGRSTRSQRLKAGDGNRTRTKSLEGSCAAVTPRPRAVLG
jgi:hypothetical protein